MIAKISRAMASCGRPIEQHVEYEASCYVERNPTSRELYSDACKVLPGGNTRATVFYPPFPISIERGEATYLWDVDGHRYLNLVGEYSAGLFGHDRAMLEKVWTEVSRSGVLLSGPTVHEQRLAGAICKRFPSCQSVRFCNSGTEANLLALGIARNSTGKDSILAFSGAYHGGVLNFPSGASPLNVPLEVLLGDFNDIDATRTLIADHASSIGAIIVEPMMGAAGCISADAAFLEMLRGEATRHGIVLIFDEVMTSRLAPGGLQEAYDVEPDLTTLGKYLGGGFSCGAVGGGDLMGLLDARRPAHLSHAGTFNNNIASMIAGYIGLAEYFTPAACLELNDRGDAFRDRLNASMRSIGAPLQVTGRGSVMNLHFGDHEIVAPKDVERPYSAEFRTWLHLYLINRGYYLARRGLITLNLHTTNAQLQEFESVFGEFVDTNRTLLDAMAEGDAA